MPFCHELKKHEDETDYAEIEKVYIKLCEIDEHLSSSEFRLQMFGEKNADKYEYQPIVRTIVEVDDTENYFRPPYARFKLELAYNDESPVFKVFDKKGGIKKEVVPNSFTEALQHIRHTTKHRMVVNFSKLYAMKTSSGNEKRSTDSTGRRLLWSAPTRPPRNQEELLSCLTTDLNKSLIYTRIEYI